MIKNSLILVSIVGALALPATASAQTNSLRNQVVGATPSISNSYEFRGPKHVSLQQEFDKGVRQFNNGNLHLAKIAFKNVVTARKAQNYSQSISYLGLIEMKRGNHKKAANLFNYALRGNPNIYGLKSLLGVAYVEMGETQKAEALLAEMIRKQHRHYENGSDEAEQQSAIDLLEKALNTAAT